MDSQENTSVALIRFYMAAMVSSIHHCTLVAGCRSKWQIGHNPQMDACRYLTPIIYQYQHPHVDICIQVTDELYNRQAQQITHLIWNKNKDPCSRPNGAEHTAAYTYSSFDIIFYINHDYLWNTLAICLVPLGPEPLQYMLCSLPGTQTTRLQCRNQNFVFSNLTLEFLSANLILNLIRFSPL